MQTSSVIRALILSILLSNPLGSPFPLLAQEDSTEVGVPPRVGEPAADSTGEVRIADLPIDLSLSGALYYQSGVTGSSIRPEYFLVDQEYKQVLEENYPWRELTYGRTDNPLYHGAGYFRFDAVSQPVKEARLQVSLIGEMRGMSYGVRDTRNMIVYPEFLFSFNHALPILGDTLHSAVMVGDRPQLESIVPLTFYNTDMQGTTITFGYRWLEYIFEKAAGDAAFGIGLNVNDANHVAIRTRGLRILDSTGVTLQAGFFSYDPIHTVSGFFSSGSRFATGSPRDLLFQEADLADGGTHLLARLDRSIIPGLQGRITLNYAVRGDNEGTFDRLMSRSGFLASLGLEGEWERGEFIAEGAYRFYGGLFNAGYRNDEPSYRAEGDEAQGNYTNIDLGSFGSTYANSIGPYLYPLSNLDYPFSRWAVFTEYQDLKDVTGWTFYARGRWRFVDQFFVGGMLDLNLIVPEKTASALYPFWRAGVGYEPYPSITLSLEATNQTMNLDKHYPTFYQIDGLSGQATIRWEIEKSELRIENAE